MESVNLNRIFRTFLIFLTAFSLSSCFELIEDIRINSDGSGRFQLTLNLSQSKTQVSRLLTRDSIAGSPIPKIQQIDSALHRATATLKAMEGISDLSLETDYQNYIVKAGFSFSSIEHLDQAFDTLQNGFSTPQKTIQLPVTYSQNNNQFSRAIENNFLAQLNDKIGNFGFGELLGAKLTSIYRFDNPVSNSTIPTTRISSSKKSTMTKCTLKEFIENPAYADLTITMQ